MTDGAWRNWGRNYSCRPASVAHPETEGELQSVLAAAAERGQRVKVVGSGHSFSDIALTDGVMISLDRYAQVLNVDPAAGTVTVQAGITLAALVEALDRRGLALPVLGEITAQAVAGAIATGTHGTGARTGNLSSSVRALRLVLADGSTMDCSPQSDPDAFRAARVGLGALGAVSTVTMRCVPAFNLHSVVERRDLDGVLASLPQLVDDNDHVDVVWFAHTNGVRLRRHNRTSLPEAPRSRFRVQFEDQVLENGVFGVMGRVGMLRPSLIPRLNRVMQRSVREADLVERSYRRFATPRSVRYVEMEYAIPRAAAEDALRQVGALLERRRIRLGFPLQLRFVAPDDIPLSPAFGRETCYLGVHEFTGKAYKGPFREIEAVLASFDGRPHWGKVHLQRAETLRPRYPEWDRFQAVRARLDPMGRFRNAYLDRVLGPVPGADG